MKTYQREVASQVSHMPIGDVFSKFKLILWGFLIPTVGIVVAFLFAPQILRYGGTWKKAQVLVVEVNETSIVKQWRLIGNLQKNGIFEKVYIILPNLHALDRNIVTVPSREEVVRLHLKEMGVGDSQIQVFRFPDGEVGSMASTAKSLMKVLVSEEIQSILVFSDEYRSQRTANTYTKVLQPLGVDVSVYPAKSDYDLSNWFLTERGVAHISKEMFLYLFYKLRGY